MSLTLVAAGVSVQDALSGMAVVKEGLGDMAVSNAIGSNIFDVLICLGAPWLGNISRLLLVQLIRYCALIGRELYSVEIFSE